jgi:hypothetical protein
MVHSIVENVLKPKLTQWKIHDISDDPIINMIIINLADAGRDILKAQGIP